MKLATGLAMIAVSCAVAVLPRVSAYACGGCFHGTPPPNTPPTATPSVVTGHRMALSISPTRTVLWDQVQYAGDPKDFAWVLPVGPGAVLEQANDAWFESLEAVTATRVMSRVITCPATTPQGGVSTFQEGSNGQGFGCGVSNAVGSTGSPPPDNGAGGASSSGDAGTTEQSQGRNDHVTVLHDGTVGPYETVTLKATDPVGLHDWLIAHGYAVPADIQPVIDAYVKAGSDFIALRLAPGVGVNKMTPVRVITPGASPTLPLRMVAAGTGPEVSIVLYVIGEGRYDTMNFATASLPASVTWDWSTSSSNYAALRSEALAGGGFLTTYSKKGLNVAAFTPTGTLATYQVNGMGSYSDLASVYFAQASANGGTAGAALPPKCQSAVASLTNEGFSAVAACPAAPMGGGVTCPTGSVDQAEFGCDGATDIATALVGMHPSDVVVTRLEAMLPHAMLNQDLVLEASNDQTAVDNWMVAPIDAYAPTCPKPAPPSANGPSPQPSPPPRSSCVCTAGPATGPLWGVWLVVGAALVGVTRRLRRRRSAPRR